MQSIKNILIVVVATLAFVGNAAAQKKPNVALILMDNYGWGEPGCCGGGILRGATTPRINKLASEGMRLLNFNGEVDCPIVP